MSFARFSEGDLYVYLNVSGLFECCCCPLGTGGCFSAPTAAEMVSHLELHRNAGHFAPARAFKELRDGAGGLDAYAVGLRASVLRASAAAGHPDPAEGCRSVIALAPQKGTDHV